MTYEIVILNSEIKLHFHTHNKKFLFIKEMKKVVTRFQNNFLISNYMFSFCYCILISLFLCKKNQKNLENELLAKKLGYIKQIS